MDDCVTVERTSDDRNLDVPAARSGDVNQVPLGTEEELSIRQNKTMQADSVLKSLSPLINSMRVFGLYFARATPGTASPLECKCIRKCQTWNAAQIYATIMLALTLLNAARYYVVIDINTKKRVDADLFFKLGIFLTNTLSCVLFSAYYVASHTGSLDRVFRVADLCTADFAKKYSRRTKLVTIVCWTFASWNAIYYIVAVSINGQYNDIALLYFIENIQILKPYADIMKAVFFVLQLISLAAWAFPQAMVMHTL